jgi:hypothetical protein
MRKDQSYLRMIHASKETIEHERGKNWREEFTAVTTDIYCLTNVSIIPMMTKIAIGIALKDMHAISIYLTNQRLSKPK